MSEEMLSSIRQKFKQLIADAYMTFQGTRGARHGVQPWQKHHYIAKEFTTTMKAAVHLGQNYSDGYRQKHQFRRAPDVVRQHIEVDLGPESRDSECLHD